MDLTRIIHTKSHCEPEPKARAWQSDEVVASPRPLSMGGRSNLIEIPRFARNDPLGQIASALYESLAMTGEESRSSQ